MFKMYIRWIFITDDPADMMPNYHNAVESITESDDPPLNVSRSKRDQGRQLKANRQCEGVHDDNRQRFTLPNHEITCPMNATYENIAMEEQNHGVKTCLIMFDEAHNLYSETDNDNVSSKSATEMTGMMYNTATLKPAYSLRSTVSADDENEGPPEELDDYHKAKKIAPLDALYPKIRVPSDD
jgi:HSP90 family molecular chaperone